MAVMSFCLQRVVWWTLAVLWDIHHSSWAILSPTKSWLKLNFGQRQKNTPLVYTCCPKRWRTNMFSILLSVELELVNIVWLETDQAGLLYPWLWKRATVNFIKTVVLEINLPQLWLFHFTRFHRDEILSEGPCNLQYIILLWLRGKIMELVLCDHKPKVVHVCLKRKLLSLKSEVRVTVFSILWYFTNILKFLFLFSLMRKLPGFIWAILESRWPR